jgi:hypothetical protein
VVFEHRSHMPHLEESPRYLRVVEAFLGGVERQEPGPGGRSSVRPSTSVEKTRDVVVEP